MSVIAVSLVLSPLAISYAEVTSQTVINLNSQPLVSALSQFSKQFNIQVFVRDSLIRGVDAPEVTSTISVEMTLEKMLQGSDLQAVWQSSTSVVITKKSKIEKVSVNEINRDDYTKVENLETITVTATRQSITIKEAPRSITVIDGTVLEQLLQTSRNLGEVLAKAVPGMAPASQTLTNYSQTLRGRNVLVLIDGVPQTINRNFSRDFSNVAAMNIERMEVVRGGTAAYGSGAAGGIINIITRAAGEESSTRIELSSSLTNINNESFNGKLNHQVGGLFEDGEYGLNFDYEKTNGFIDANGDRIAPEPSQGDLSDTETFTIAGKLNLDLTDSSKLTISFSHLDSRQDTDYISDPSVTNAPAGSERAIAVKGLNLKKQNETRNSMVNVMLKSDVETLGTLDSQLYFRDYYARFFPYNSDIHVDGIKYNKAPIQNYVESQNIGGRLSFRTLLTDSTSISWGTDFNHERTENLATVYDSTILTQSGGLDFVRVGEAIQMPLTDHDSVAIFAQYETYFTNQLRWEAGLRQEWIKVSFDDFVSGTSGSMISASKKPYNDMMFNTGLVYFVNDEIQTYVNYAQGFTLPDIGLQLRKVAEDYSLSQTKFQPIKTDDYEVGIRGDWQQLSSSLAIYSSKSDLGNPALETIDGGKYIYQSRNPERIHGAELTASYVVTNQLEVGGYIAWSEGKSKHKTTGEWKSLNGFRIAPLQARAFINYQMGSGWLNRVQVNYSGNRDSAAKDLGKAFGAREVESYTTVDYVGSIETKRGLFTAGIENLLNHDYYSVYGQLLRNFNNTSHIPATGITAKVSYQYFW